MREREKAIDSEREGEGEIDKILDNQNECLIF